MLPSSAWGRLRFSQAFPILIGSLALLLLAKAPGKLARPEASEAAPSGAAKPSDAPADDPSGGATNEAPGEDASQTPASFAGELPSRGCPHGVRAEKSGGPAIVFDHVDPTLERFRSWPDSFRRASPPCRPASPFAPRAPPSSADLVDFEG